jgi:Uma2 family endonuclease
MQSPIHFLSVSEYLYAEAIGEIRHEYIGGEVYAMAGASEEHNLIALSVASRLHLHLLGTPCRAFISDMKLRVKVQKTDIFYYPDILVACEPTDNERYFKTRPSLIIEVASNTTKITDKREKLLSYQTISSLQEYVLISQDEIKVEVYRQDLEGNWTRQVLGKENELRLNSVDLTLSMSIIYENVF